MCHFGAFMYFPAMNISQDKHSIKTIFILFIGRCKTQSCEQIINFQSQLLYDTIQHQCLAIIDPFSRNLGYISTSIFRLETVWEMAHAISPFSKMYRYQTKLPLSAVWDSISAIFVGKVADRCPLQDLQI